LNNSGFYGGGLWLCDTLAMINNCTISENESEQDGGGILNDNSYYDDGMLTITNSMISDNQTLNSGGGIFNDDGALFNMNNCTISKNRSEINGGGILNEGTMTMYGCMIDNNYADDSGGAIAILEETGLVIKGNTISNNSATHCGGIMLWLTSQPGEIPNIGGVYSSEKNTICGNYKGTDAASVHQAIRDYYTGSLYNDYRYINDIMANCPQ